MLKERDDDDDEHFVDVDDDDDARNASDAAAAAAGRASDADRLSAKSSWVHRNNSTCVLCTLTFLVVIVCVFYTTEHRLATIL